MTRPLCSATPRKKRPRLGAALERWGRAVATLAGFLVIGSCGPGELRPTHDPVTEVSIRAVASNPEQHVDHMLELTGRLENIGTDYFTDLRVVLRDSLGYFVYVTPWLPIEVPPPPPAGDQTMPATLSQYLDNDVLLIGKLEPLVLKDVGEVLSLRVESAEIVSSEP